MPNLTPLRIFLVEDHEDTLLYFGMYLRHIGHEVVEARTMAEALEKLPVSGCNVLFSDIGLPDGNGWELLEQVKLPQPIFAVAISGFGMSADRIRSREVGYRHHLIKPPPPEKIDAILEEAMAELS